MTAISLGCIMITFWVWLMIFLLEERPRWAVRAWIFVKRVVRHRFLPPWERESPRFDFDSAYDAAMAIDIEGEPESAIRAWTAEEREVLGISDTVQAISRIDRELQVQATKGLRTTPPERVLISESSIITTYPEGVTR